MNLKGPSLQDSIYKCKPASLPIGNRNSKTLHIISRLLALCVYTIRYMAGGSTSSQHKKSSTSSFSSFLKLFKPKRSSYRGEEAYWDESVKACKVWPSDEDRGYWWVAEPGIDRKASAYIAKFRAAASQCAD